MIRIVFDSNTLISSNTLSNTDGIVVKDAAEQLGYTLTLPKVVLDEMINKRRELIRENISKMRNAKRDLNRVGLPHEQPLPSDEAINQAVSNYAHDLAELFPGESILSYPASEHEFVLKRSIEKRRPFLGEDKGYRDTLIWLSTLELLINSDDRVILISQDHGFREQRESQDIHKDLSNDLEEAEIHPDRLLLYTNLLEFINGFINPQLQFLEDTKMGILNGSILIPDVEDKVNILVNEEATGDELDPEDLFVDIDVEVAYIEVLEENTLVDIYDVRKLPSGDLYIQSSWEGEVSIELTLPPWEAYAESSEVSGIQLTPDSTAAEGSINRAITFDVNMILDDTTFEIKTLSYDNLEIQEPSWL